VALHGHGGHSHRLEVFNLHLGLSAAQRERQLARLVRSRELSSLGLEAACLVGGDFNDWRSRLSATFTAGLLFRSATDHSSSGQRPMATYPAFFPRGPLDRIYYRGPLRLLSAHRCRLRASRIASDHLPVIADFEIH
jgi:endonuclease/exonuclease/phosphatase family metal-dependent hydrolase